MQNSSPKRVLLLTAPRPRPDYTPLHFGDNRAPQGLGFLAAYLTKYGHACRIVDLYAFTWRFQGAQTPVHSPWRKKRDLSGENLARAMTGDLATLVEKHFTLGRSQTGSWHFFSMSPADLKRLVQNIRLCEKALGSGEVRARPAEQTARERARRSLVAERPIRKGETLTEQMIGVKRPGTGLPPSQIDRVVGRTTKVDIAADEQIHWGQLIEKAR